MQNNTTTLLEKTKEILIQELENYEGQTFYGCDLACELLQNYNVDGCINIWTAAEREFVFSNYDEFGDVIERAEDEWGELLNPFINPHKTAVIGVIMTAEAIMAEIPLISDNWNDEITLNAETIKTIAEHINDIESVEV